MSWVKDAITGLSNGNEVKVRPNGGSMRGRIESGQLVTMVPATFDTVNVDDVVFVKWKGNYLLHLVKEKRESELLIGNNIGKINGWVPANSVLAIVVKVED